MSYHRPIIPYKGENAPFNNRYDIQATTNKALKAQDLDGEFNYVIDSLNKLSGQIAGKTLEIIEGSDKAINRDKIIVTNGLLSPTLSWVKVNSQHIEKNAIENHHINDTSVTTNKINNDAVNNDKIENEAITPNKVKIRFENDAAQYEQKKQWSNTIAETNNKVGTIVGRDIEGDINVSGLKFNSTGLQDSPTDLSEYLMVAASDITGEFKPVALGDLISKEFEKIKNKALDDVFDKEHPVHSYNFNNPRQGEVVNGKKVDWMKFSHGYVLATSGVSAKEDQGQAGSTSIIGKEGATEGHKLKISEMPQHYHEINFTNGYKYVHSQHSGDAFAWQDVKVDGTGTAGADEPHFHNIDVKRIELPLYKRVS